MTENPNIALWNEAFMTDPKAVKPITGKSYKGNSPKPFWLIERATQVFGPVGIGWGCTVKSERFERMSDTDVLHVAVVSVWYVRDGKRSETFDQMGGTKACYKTSSGSLLVDEDAGKKSVTDGMVKCLSMIGFAGDIFSGRWDDSKYVQHAAEEWAARNDPEAGSRADQRQRWLADQLAGIDAAATVGEMKDVLARAIFTAQEEKDDEAVGILQAAAATKIAKAKKASRETA